MVNSRRAKFFEVVASCLKVTMEVSMAQSVMVAVAPAGDQITDEHSDSDPDGDGLIRMFMHGGVGRFGAGDRLVTDPAADLFGAFERGGETLAGFADFFAGHVRGGGQ
jgi:hypothetical protein